MSKDIRSFFQVLSKKTGSHTNSAAKSKKTAVIRDSDDEDLVKATPEKTAVEKKGSHHKRRAQVLSSDSEDEGKKKKNKTPVKNPKKSEETSKPKSAKLKPINLDDINKTVKQTKVEPAEPTAEPIKNEVHEKTKNTKKDKNSKKKKAELGIHGDKNFEKTLQELDEDSDDTILIDNLDLLDKTIEEATHKEEVSKKDSGKKEEKHKKEELNEKKSPEKLKEATHTPKKPEKRQRKDSGSAATPTTKKQKLEHTDSGIDPDQERWEKKRHSAQLYQAYLHRGAPKNHGQKEYPKGKPDCLHGLTFLKTGVLDSLESEEFQNLVKEHGGRVVHAVSRKVNYVVVGDDAGPSKLQKACDYNIPQVSEDEFLDLILTKSGKKPKYTIKSMSEDLGIEMDSPKSNKSKSSEESSPKREKHQKNGETESSPKNVPKKELEDTEQGHSKDDENESKESPPKEDEVPAINRESDNPKVSNENLQWTEKYKPTSLKNIIGQQDPNSNLNKLKTWLETWFENQKPEVRKKLPRPTPYNQHGGKYFKAALLSGPPGVGKTTTATLVAKELGFDVVEFNASDTRSKKLLHEEISQMMKSKTVAGFLSGGEHNLNQKRVLLMDEVDGMAGNEDRGGMAELINFIKSASFPIICMCNDRDHPKMRTLINHCYGLRFGKPNMTQIRGAMLSVCFKEGLKVKPDALAQLILGTDCDIRQTLNHLAMWSAAEKNLSVETVQKESKNSQKDVTFGPWEVIKKVFNKSENKDMSLIDKSRLFFYDYSMGPLFVQENYLNANPDCTGPPKERDSEKLIRACLTADSLSMGDIIEAKIRSTNNWSILECQAIHCTVLPSYYMSGTMGKVNFPRFFGKLSQMKKSQRIISELYSHARTTISSDKVSMRLDYASTLRDRLVKPLQLNGSAGVNETIQFMKSYKLLKDDLINLCDLLECFNQPNVFKNIDVKIKTALTKLYNKEMVLSFAPPTASKKKKANADYDDLLGEEDEVISEDEGTEDNINDDALIKVKAQGSSSKASTSKAESKTKAKAKSSKGKK